MARYPGAVWRPITADKMAGAGTRPRLTVVNRANLHSTASTANSQFGYFNQSGIPDSHFHIAYDGEVEQYVDTAFQAFADLEGNDATISIETAGCATSSKAVTEKWTDAQVVSIVKLLIWIFEEHNIPRRLATNSKIGESSHGLSWHRLGCDGNFPALPSVQAGRLQRGGGMRYSKAVGKVCPGYARIDQIHQAIWPALIDALRGEPATGGFLMALSDRDQEAVLWNVRNNRTLLDQNNALLTEIKGLLTAPIKDGDGAAPPREIQERTLDVARRTLEAVENQTPPEA